MIRIMKRSSVLEPDLRKVNGGIDEKKSAVKFIPLEDP